MFSEMVPSTVRTLDDVGFAYSILPVAILVVDLHGTAVMANQTASGLVGREAGAIVGVALADLISPELGHWFMGIAFQRRPDVVKRQLWRGPDGSPREVQLQVSWLNIGSEPHAVLCLTDITPIARPEPATLESLHSIVEHSEASIFLLQVTTHDTFLLESLNPAAQAVIGVQSDQALGRSTGDLFDPAQASRMEANYRRCLEQGHPVTYEETVDSSNTRRIFRTTLIPIRDAQGRVFRLVGLGHDITEQRQAEDALAASKVKQLEAEDQARHALEQSQRRFSLAFDASPDALVLVEVGSGRFLEVNRGFERLFGIPRSDAVGKSSLELGIWQSPVERERARAVARRDGSLRDFPILGRNRRGEPVHCLLSIEVIDIEGRPAFLTVIRDVTKVMRAEQAHAELEQQLRQAQKMDALGNFAGGIAHDFNNILGAIFANAELIRLDVGDTPSILEDVDAILQSAHRAKDLVRRILMFSRRQPLERKFITADAPVREALRWLRSTLPTTIELECSLTNEPLTLLADETQLQQVMMNLGANAAYAMRGRAGRLRLMLETVVADQELVVRFPTPQARRYAKITVQDDGEGMPSDIRARIFEPFFTTKPQGEGTGLGLAVAHGIIREHDGTIVVESEPGSGSAFIIYLPEQDERPSRTSAPPELMRGKGQRVLIVDDDESLCRAVAALLSSLNYDVTAIGNPIDALRLVESQPEGFRLVLADLTMPGMSGVELAAAIHAVAPSLPVVVMSGYARDHTRESLCAQGIADLVAKPLSAVDLAQCIANNLITPHD